MARIPTAPKLPTEEDVEQGRAIVIKPGLTKWVNQLETDDLKTLARFQFHINAETKKKDNELMQVKQSNEQLRKDLASSQ